VVSTPSGWRLAPFYEEFVRRDHQDPDLELERGLAYDDRGFRSRTRRSAPPGSPRTSRSAAGRRRRGARS